MTIPSEPRALDELDRFCIVMTELGNLLNMLSAMAEVCGVEPPDFRPGRLTMTANERILFVMTTHQILRLGAIDQKFARIEAYLSSLDRFMKEEVAPLVEQSERIVKPALVMPPRLKQ